MGQAAVLFTSSDEYQAVVMHQRATYAYDAQDRLTGITPASGSSASYVYDHAGRRVNATVGADARTFVWDVASTYGDIVAEFDGSGALLASKSRRSRCPETASGVETQKWYSLYQQYRLPRFNNSHCLRTLPYAWDTCCT